MKHVGHPIPAALARPQSSLSSTEVADALARTVAKLAPVWPLTRFVAVNPFVGLAEQSFEDAALTLARTAGARTIMPRSFYLEAWRREQFDAEDLAWALAQRGLADVESSVAWLEQLDADAGWDPGDERLTTVAELAGDEWPRRVLDAISSWAASYFDEGQAAWPCPWRELSPFRAWQAEAALDRGPELLGVLGFRERVAALPSEAVDAAAWAIERLALTRVELDEQLHRLLMSIAGWAGYARFRSWTGLLRGEPDQLTPELLCVRLVWDALLLDALAQPGLAQAWRERRRIQPGAAALDGRALEIDLALHAAYERGVDRRLFAKLPSRAPDARPINRFAQAVFCIDVRSEPIRRALESLDPGVETRGFAGFFGVAVELIEFGHGHGGPRCPVLVEPAHAVAELPRELGIERCGPARARVRVRAAAAQVWASFRQAAVASFGFVETLGLGYGLALLGNSLELAPPVSSPSKHAREHLRPSLEPTELVGRRVGITHAQRVEIAATMLRSMSMTRELAPLVVLFGHEATCANNPHATGLDCGACGGHSGAANARVATAILNDSAVRAALVERGITIPSETWFVAGLHDTTTDTLTLFDLDEVPSSHRWELERLQARMPAASARVRAERAPSLGVDARADLEQAMRRRSRNWAEVRPEWGLAGCSAFIAAPRRRTRGVELGGRVFLHDYEWRDDPEFAVLETIMTAPMVVAAWIALQYYGSTVDNEVFGCGDKVLHNVVGTLGVLEGRGGDLRVGLAMQSIHDGRELVHAPVRLAAILEAPIDAINRVIGKHPQLRALLDNGWLRLFAMDEHGAVSHRHLGQQRWESACERGPRPPVAAVPALPK